MTRPYQFLKRKSNSKEDKKSFIRTYTKEEYDKMIKEQNQVTATATIKRKIDFSKQVGLI